MLSKTIQAFAFLCISGIASPCLAQQNPPPAQFDPEIVADLVAASRILADQGVLDAFGHVTIRNPKNPEHFFMSRSLAPALVTPADIVELDLDGNEVDGGNKTLFLERFIHGEIYRKRPDVMSVVHSHSPSVIPFSVSKQPMKAMYHNAAFLAAGVPIFDIRDKFGATDMLVRNKEIGKALAEALGDKPVALMRGHGSVATGPNVQLAVFRAVYTEVDAKLQAQAMALGGDVNALTPEEGVKADKVNEQIVGRAWGLWKQRVAGQ